MVRLISINCPTCNANMNVNAELKQVQCSFCGNFFYVEDNSQHVKIEVDGIKQLGREFEYGRIDARNEGADKDLIHRVDVAYKIITEIETKQKRINEIAHSINIIRNQIRIKENTSLKYIVAILLFLIIVGVVCLPIPTVIKIATGIILMILIFVFWESICNVYEIVDKKMQGNVDELRDRIIELDNEKKTLFKSVVEQKKQVDFIPERYQHESVIKRVLSYMNNKRAVSLVEAFNLYENELQNRRMEEMQRRQLQYQTRQIEMQREQLEEIKKERAEMKKELEKNRKKSFWERVMEYAEEDSYDPFEDGLFGWF